MQFVKQGLRIFLFDVRNSINSRKKREWVPLFCRKEDLPISCSWTWTIHIHSDIAFFHRWLSRRCQFQRISDKLMKFAPKINIILPNNMVNYRGQIQSLAAEIAVQSSGSLFLNDGNLSAFLIFWFFTYKFWWPVTCRVFKLQLWIFYQLKTFAS